MHRVRFTHGLAALGLCCMAAPAAFAVPAFTYLSQTRTVSVKAHAAPLGEGPTDPAVDTSQSQSAPDFGPFHASINTTANGTATDPTDGEGFASAQQDSVLGTNTLQVSTTTLANGSAIDGMSFGNASSIAKVSFTVDSPTSYTLTGHLDLIGNAIATRYEVIAEIKGPNGSELLPRIDAFEPPAPGELGSPFDKAINQSGTLAPGQYFLDVEAIGIGPEGVRSESALTLTASSTPAIPLPSAAYMSLPLLGGLGLFGAIQRRRAVVS